MSIGQTVVCCELSFNEGHIKRGDCYERLVSLSLTALPKHGEEINEIVDVILCEFNPKKLAVLPRFNAFLDYIQILFKNAGIDVSYQYFEDANRFNIKFNPASKKQLTTFMKSLSRLARSIFVTGSIAAPYRAKSAMK